jgi:hypothetical protein
MPVVAGIMHIIQKNLVVIVITKKLACALTLLMLQ